MDPYLKQNQLAASGKFWLFSAADLPALNALLTHSDPVKVVVSP